jgi:TonB-dependent starch-binding outer membrane protein SusC
MKLFFTLFLTLLIYATLSAQQVNVSGTVSDAQTNEPLIGVAITVLPGKIGTVTDINGNFSLPTGDSLVLRYVGYAELRMAITRRNLRLQMEPTAAELTEVVVIGYGSQSRRDVTGSVVSVSGKDLEKKPITRIENALQGQAAGVQVTQYSGKPGNTMSIRVRGATSLSAGNEPLYVVDGVPILNTEGLNPADISSIEVLKDASASAIYGARAANGVVLITTKRGTAGRSTISFASSAGISQVTRQLDMLNTADYIALINESYTNSGQQPRLNPEDYTVYNTNWQDEIYRDAATSNHQLSAQGGSENSRYFLSINRQNQDGIVRESGYKRTGVRFNFSSDLRKNIAVGSNFNLSNVRFAAVPDNSRVNQGGVILGALSSPPLIGIYNEDGTYTTNPLQSWENPVANIEAPIDNVNTNRVVGNVFLDLGLLKNLKFKTSFGIEAYNNKNDYFLDPFRTQFGRSLQGIGTVSTNQELIWLSENTLTYQRQFKQHHITVLGGVTAQESRYEGTFARAEGFPNGTVTSLNAGSRKIEASSFASQWALFSYLGRASYKFNEKYLVDVNFRADGSSRFGANHRYSYFPSASVGWRISEEGFMRGVKAINDMKLRVSVGTNGNQNIGDFASYGLYATGSNYNLNGVILPGTRPSSIGNADLRWETTSQWNAGIDLTIADYRLNFTADIYQKNTRDLLINVDLPQSTGFSSGIQNLGAIRNSGVELAVRSKNVIRPKFNWSTNFNISANRNEVENIGGPDKIIFAGNIPESGFSVIVQEGLPLGAFYGFVNQGVNPENGDLVFADLNADGVVNDDDRRVIGDPNPDFIAGFGNNISWGNFELDVLFQAVYGNDVLNATRIETEAMNSVKNGSAETLTRWRNPGDITRMPRAVFGDPNRNARISDRFIEDGSYLRLRNITLTYNLPAVAQKRMRLQQAALFVSGQNIWTLTNYSGYDPEVNRDGGSSTSQGIDYGTYPQARLFTGGIRFDF